MKATLVISAMLVSGWLFADSEDANGVLLADSEDADRVLLDRVVAVAGDEPILYSEAQSKIKKEQMIVFSTFPAGKETTQMEQAVNDLINLRLAEDGLEELGVEIGDEEVERQIAQFLQSRQLQKQDLLAFLQARGKTYEEYEQDFREQILVRKFQSTLIVPQIKLTDADVLAYFLQKTGSESAVLHLQQIVVSPDKHTVIATAHRELQEGLSFEIATDLYHDKEHQRAMPPVLLKNLAGKIKASVKNLKKGEFSAPVKTALGYHIFYIKDKTFKDTNEFSKQKATLELELQNHKMAEYTKRWLQEKRAKTSVKFINYPALSDS